MQNSAYIPRSLGAPALLLCLRARSFLLAAAVLLLLFSARSTTFAGSATWKLNPTSGNWNTAANWTPATVPNGVADTATFAVSNTTAVSLSAATEVNSIVFNPSASAFTITVPSAATSLTITGVGITNDSGISQNFVAFPGLGAVNFTSNATAGSQTVFTATGSASGGGFGGRIFFFDNSTAGDGTFISNGATVSGGFNGLVSFSDSANAGDGTFIDNGGTISGASGGITSFSDSSTAGNANFTNKSRAVDTAFGGIILFSGTSTAGNGVFTNEGNGNPVNGTTGGRHHH